MNIRPTNGHPSITHAVRAYRKEHPEHTGEQVAAALGITRRQVENVHYQDERRSAEKRGQATKREIEAARLLPMLAGPGDRHSECQRYEACLTRAAAINAEAHCPEACAEYKAIPREHYLTKAILVPRVSYQANAQGGRLW